MRLSLPFLLCGYYFVRTHIALQFAHIICKLTHANIGVEEMEAPYSVLVIIHKNSGSNRFVFDFEKEILFPFIVFNKMRAFRLDEPLQLLITVAIILMQEQ